jgi:hypothetical protein
MATLALPRRGAPALPRPRQLRPEWENAEFCFKIHLVFSLFDRNLDGLKEIGRDLIEFRARWLELVAGVEFVWRRRGEVRWCRVQFSPPTSPSTLYK